MKNNSKQSGQRIAFTIVELLTVITIIAILIGILVPSLRAVRLSAKKVKQKSQLHALDTALEVYRNDTGDYPPSYYLDPENRYYNGALKLAEAMLGQDLFGQHVKSVFRVDGYNSDGTEDLYPPPPIPNENLDSRLPVYLKLENANAFKMKQILFPISPDGCDPLWPERYVLCDVFGRGNRTAKIGMPVLYYRAHPEKKLHDPNDRINDYANNIYNFNDNLCLIGLGIPGAPGEDHPFIDDTIFYDQTRNKKVPMPWPYNAESFILLSAGPDGKYGTPDDIGNYNY